MSSREPRDSIEGLEDVTRAYRDAAFGDQPPAHLDRAILAAARRRPKPRLAAFIPALALAATVVLSFSIVLRSGLVGIGGVEAPLEQVPASALESRRDEDRAQTAPSPGRSQQDAPSPAGGFADAPQEEGLTSTPTLRLEGPATPQSPQPIVEDDEVGMSAAAASRAATPEDSLATETPAAEAGARADRSSLVSGDAMDCRGGSGGDPADWVACIERRLAGGAQERARAELEAFVSEHPDFPLPQDLQALRPSQPR